MKRDDRLKIGFRALPDGEPMTEVGRRAWALRELVNAGPKGCTPIDNPGPRWSGYVHRLRGRGLVIETINENHDGQFAGAHARYVLHSKISIISDSSKPNAEGIAA